MSEARRDETLMPNMLYFGDNFDWLPKIEPESLDLIYLDPRADAVRTDLAVATAPAMPEAATHAMAEAVAEFAVPAIVSAVR